MRSLMQLMLVLFAQDAISQSAGHLFLMTENDRFGYINEKAELLIPPRFLSAADFSDGLAAVREHGLYGYIDEKGEFTIQPAFDYAESFHEGLALVYQNGLPLIINREGKKAFPVPYRAIASFNCGRAEVISFGGKHGYIDKHGKLFIDTVYESITGFKQGLAVVEGVSVKTGEKYNVQVGVIDSLGRFIINYGSYQNVEGPEAGYLKVRIAAEPWDTLEEHTGRDAFLNKEGKLIYSRDHSHHSWISGNLHCGLIPIRLSKRPNDLLTDFNDWYMGYINLKGEIVITDTNYTQAKDFSENRAFAGRKNYSFDLIDTHGKIYAKDLEINDNGVYFKNGLALVATDRKWGVIDTNGNYLLKPQFNSIDWALNTTDYFFFSKEVEGSDAQPHRRSGIVKHDGSIMVPPIMEDYARKGFLCGLLTCVIDGKLSYLDKAGKIVWQEKTNKAGPLKKLNIDYMNRGYFYAFSKPLKNANGGYGHSDNWPKPNKKTDLFPKNCLSIIASPEQKDTAFSNQCMGMKVFIANTGKAPVMFNASDSRLYMKVQAINAKGEWQDIEYLPSSWCGNSYHVLTLNPDFHWSFTMPEYEGDYKTRLRVEVQYIDPADKATKQWEKKSITIYSNEFEGSINPAQFWRKPGYTPGGIMDPYFD